MSLRRPTLGLVVPSLHQGGGVPAVAGFLVDVAERSGEWDLQIISLCMASDDPESTSLRRPGGWLRQPGLGTRAWRGRDIAHVGARWGEIEFQRYRTRPLLRELVRRCDVVQVVAGSPAWANAVIGAGVPVSLQVATLARVERRRLQRVSDGPLALWRRAMTAITARMDDHALRHVDAVQVENPWMLSHVQRVNQGRSAADIRYAPPGVDEKIYSPAPERALADGHVLCVGRLDDPRKNIGLLLDAYAFLPAALRARHGLVLAGASAPAAPFWARVEALGLGAQVRYAGRPSTEDLVALYQGAKVFALSSDEEGLGVVVLEAMACGIPAVCTRSGGPDGIITDGEDGLLVPLDDPHALSGAIGRLLADDSLNSRMGEAARRTIEERYSRAVAGTRFRDVWKSLLSARSAAARGAAS